MTAISLNIIQPINDDHYIGTPTVIFRGVVSNMPEEVKNTTLYYRWYASLNPTMLQDHYSMNEIAQTDPGMPFSQELGLGTHIIILAVSDRSGQTEADAMAAQHGGLAGGSSGSGKCVIHVFKAHMIEPTGSELLQRNAVLVAEAPLLWGKVIQGVDKIALNEEYQKINRLQYRWEFVPIVSTGATDLRKTVQFIPTVETYTIESRTVADKDIMTIKYTGELPTDLRGDYQLILHVEDTLGFFGGHETSPLSCTIS